MKNLLIISEDSKLNYYALDDDELGYVLYSKHKKFYRDLAISSGMTRSALHVMQKTKGGRLEILRGYFKINDFKGIKLGKIISLKIADLDQ